MSTPTRFDMQVLLAEYRLKMAILETKRELDKSKFSEAIKRGVPSAGIANVPQK